MDQNNNESANKIDFSLYLKKLMLPVIVELAFILSYIIWPEKILYFDLFYCIIIIVYFRKLFSFSKWVGFFKIRQFWIASVGTALVSYLIFRITRVLSLKGLLGMSDGLIQTIIPGSTTIIGSLLNILLYALVSIIFPPFVESLFYRRAIVRFEKPNLMVVTAIVGMILCSLHYALGWPGIIEGVLITLPITIIYLITHNIYISVTAQLIVGLLRHTYTIIYDVARILTR